MNILHIITSLKIGGAERALCNLLESLSQREFQHHVAYFYDGPCVDTIKNLQIPTYHIKGFVHRYDPISWIKLYQLIKTIKPTAIHSSLWMANIMGRILGTYANIPVISDLHGNSFDEGPLRNFLDRYTAHFSFRIIAVSPTVKQTYEQNVIRRIAHQHRQRLSSERLMVINNGIDAHKLRSLALQNPLNRNTLKIPQDAFVIGTVGRLEPIKSYDILINAFALFCTNTNLPQPPFLIIIGDGSQKSHLEHLTASLGLKNQILFTGIRQDVYRFYPLFDCFALSSQSEGLSIAMLEALSFGLPIITTHQSQQHDVISHATNGFLVPPNNPTSMAKALTQLYQDNSLRQSMKQANIDLVNKKFNLYKTANAYEQVFKSTTKTSV